MTTTALAKESIPQNPEQKLITASLIEEQGGYHFRLTCQGETLTLDDSHALKKWTAMGLTSDHHIKFIMNGIEMDGKTITYKDSHAIETLERLVNQRLQFPSFVSREQGTKPRSETSSSEVPVAAAGDGSGVSGSIRVTNDGFEFHVSYLTKFGETKTEALDAALATFQNMGFFKPHVNVQKLGIRLVVTEWDGDTFIEKRGIDDLNRATPQDLEEFLKTTLQGGSSVRAVAPETISPRGRNPIVRLKLVKTPHDLRFRVVFHHSDGTSTEGPVLVRANIGKLREAGVFKDGVKISMSVLNDALIVESPQASGGECTVCVTRCPLNNHEDARNAEQLLNSFLSIRTEKTPPNPEDSCPPAATKSAAVASALTSQAMATEPQPHADNLRTSPEESATRTQTPAIPAPKTSTEATDPPENTTITLSDALVKSHAGADPKLTNRMSRFLASQSFPISWTEHGKIFESVQSRLNQAAQVNDHGFPSITLFCEIEQGRIEPHEMVLMPHHLLFVDSIGYVRFGAETRVYLNRLHDFAEFSENCLRGIAVHGEENRWVLIMDPRFLDFLSQGTGKEYGEHFKNLMVAPFEVPEDFELVWPHET